MDELKKMEVLLHPVRMRIVQFLLDGKERSPQELSELIKDTPRTSIYRQIGILHEAEMIKVVREQPVRGTVEKFYQLDMASMNVSPEEFQSYGKEEHLHLFFTFLFTLYKDFHAYLERENVSLEKDGVGYRQVMLQLNDEEMQQLGMELSEVVMNYMTKQPSPDAKGRAFTTIVMPK
ncbi:helix-turn-helix domain-containing protein [Bacillus sp. CGMCC 1.16541]|uniref:helix-turn-helix domain-containing protein n=1 Tax=Bacillus sp. CGMCC 1.16541 TaxID=2185143 RepID=UPI000D73767A|nr:helix-turn-helix domain-containing protein [Bacillus sp. CGMCC 1.16541]